MPFPSMVKLVEVGPRDGLQNESRIISTDIKIEFINRLSETGLSVIEATSFVSPKWIPQFFDQNDVYQQINKKMGVEYPVLVPNLIGLEKAMAVNVGEIAVFTTPSEQFSQKNTNCSVAESLQRIGDIIKALPQHVRARGYVSCVLGCPYEGEISPDAVADIAEKLLLLGCYEISLGDTIGVGTPFKMKALLERVSTKVPVSRLAIHCHDTYGQALANIYVALEAGVSVIDCSVSGLGGCPYALGATGNVASEDVLYMLNNMNIKTQVDLEKLIQVGQFITKHLGITTRSKVNLAYTASHKQ